VFSFFPDGKYSRVTHYNDMVPHVPPEAMGFKHSGNEVWYYNSGTDMNWKECENSVSKEESNKCSDSLLITTGIDAHLTYLGLPISSMCSTSSISSNDEEITEIEPVIEEINEVEGSTV
jgi:hypothetical protein